MGPRWLIFSNIAVCSHVSCTFKFSSNFSFEIHCFAEVSVAFSMISLAFLLIFWTLCSDFAQSIAEVQWIPHTKGWAPYCLLRHCHYSIVTGPSCGGEPFVPALKTWLLVYRSEERKITIGSSIEILIFYRFSIAILIFYWFSIGIWYSIDFLLKC